MDEIFWTSRTKGRREQIVHFLRLGRVHRFIFSVRFRSWINMQLDRLRVPRVHVYEGSGVTAEGWRYKMAYILGGVRLFFYRGVLFRFHRRLVSIVLAVKVHLRDLVLPADWIQRVPGDLLPYHSSLLPEAPWSYRWYGQHRETRLKCRFNAIKKNYNASRLVADTIRKTN